MDNDANKMPLSDKNLHDKEPTRRPDPKESLMSPPSDISEIRRLELELEASETRFRTLFNHLTDAALIFDPRQDKIVDANLGVCQMLGYSKEELLSLNISDIHSDDLSAFRSFAQSVIDSTHGRTEELTCVTGSGDELPTEMSASVIKLDGRRYIFALVRDISQRKQTAQTLHQYAERLKILREIDHDLLAIRSPHEIAESVLRWMQQLIPCVLARVVTFDFSNAEATVLATFSCITHTIEKDTRLPLTELSYLDVLQRGEIHITGRADGLVSFKSLIDSPEIERVRSYISVPLIAQSQLIGALNVGAELQDAFSQEYLDIIREVAASLAVVVHQAQLRDKLKQYTNELEQRVVQRTLELTEANERLKELDRMKSKFVSDVSHELRTPIAGLALQLYLLENGDPLKRARHLDLAKRRLSQLTELVEDILDLSRLESDYSRSTVTILDMNLIVEQVVNSQFPIAKVCNLELTFKPANDLSLVEGDGRQLARVVTNLVTNAIKYTSSGSVRVRTWLDRNRQRVLLDIQDSGQGIEAEDIPHLFERFYRGRGVAQSSNPGTGLGLSIVKEIIDNHGGEIEVESEVGKGSIFRIWLPAHQSTDDSSTSQTSKPNESRISVAPQDKKLRGPSQTDTWSDSIQTANLVDALDMDPRAV